MSAAEIIDQLEREGISPLSPEEGKLFATYLILLMKWNRGLNLTSVRSEADTVLRHFGESILCARSVPAGTKTLLDFGSGAGFPGVPCAILRAEVQVTLAEAHRKKASFLAEVQRVLGIHFAVYGGRVEEMDTGKRFDVITLRAVERMERASRSALDRLAPAGILMILTTNQGLRSLETALPEVRWIEAGRLPHSRERILAKGERVA